MLPRTSGLREKLGLAVGAALSPLFLAGSAFRDARFFHPRGVCFHARVEPAKVVRPNLEELAQRLSGDALVRMSSGMWREEHRLLPNLLGFSIRFKAWPPLEYPTDDAQDLLTATARSPWTVALDSFRTNQHDFLLNHYYGISPFEIDGHGSIQIRVTPKPVPSEGRNRYQRLTHAVANSDVTLLLEILDKRSLHDWQAVVEIHLEQEVEIDESKLRFWPFRSGLGIKPKGFIHYLRPMPYVASRFGRSKVNKQEVQALEARANRLIEPAEPSIKQPQASAAPTSKGRKRSNRAKATVD